MEVETLKKKIMLISIAFIFAVVIGAIVIYNNIFPLAEPIKLPTASEVYAIEIKKENISEQYTSDKEIAEILGCLSKAKATRIITAHERPVVREYYTVNFYSKEEWQYTSFVYKENFKWYIEQPYYGVYEIEKELADFLPYIENLVEDTKANLFDLIPMVRIQGKLYLDTGKESDLNPRCGVMDGKITSTVEPFEKPTQENQSNFGSGFEYQFVSDNSIDIYMNEKWIRFENRD